MIQGFLADENEAAGVYPLLLLAQESGSAAARASGGPGVPTGSEGGVSGAMMLAATFARKSECLSKVFLHEESAISKYSLVLSN